MKKTFKKIAASMMAIASLNIGVTGLSASAANTKTPVSPNAVTGYVYFGPSSHAKAGIYCDSSQIVLSTSDNFATSVTVRLTGAGYASLSSGLGITYAGTTYVSHTYRGSGIQYANGEHTATENGRKYTTNTSH